MWPLPKLILEQVIDSHTALLSPGKEVLCISGVDFGQVRCIVF
jgi:hypothetical protein